MEKGWKKWLEGERVKKLFRRDNLLVLILVGILLFIIALPTKNRGSDGDGKTMEKESAPIGRETTEEADGTREALQAEDYAAEMERRLTEALADMDQVGQVKVMITLKSSGRLVVEKESPVTRSETTETDAQGGSRKASTSEIRESVVYSTEGGNSTPYVVKTYVPEIEGVLVVAEGAGSGTVNRTVTEIVQALFSVDAHKVMVVKMETKTR